MNQAELRQMAEERVKDAKALLDGRRWDFAYYSAGYAIECALKSCVLARMIHTAWIFERKWKADVCLTHDFVELIELAGLTAELNEARKHRPAFVGNWGAVVQWEPACRYETRTEAEALSLLAAITADPDGVLTWIRNYW